jgi:hypothetical protein
MLPDELKSPVYLVGWPGSGKSRFKQQLLDLGLTKVREARGLAYEPQSNERVVSAIDARYRIDEVRELKMLVEAGQHLVLMFWTDIDLEQQAWWLAQLKTLLNGRGCLKVGRQGLNADQVAIWLQQAGEVHEPDWPVLDCWEFVVPRLVLDHLLFVLDAAQNSTNAVIWRVSGAIRTLEYVNPVAVEAGRGYVTTYPASGEAELGCLHVQSQGVNHKQWQEWLQACYAPGEE